MPQLNPAPWFYTLITLWLIIILILKPTIINSPAPAKPLHQKLQTNTNPWMWTWH